MLEILTMIMTKMVMKMTTMVTQMMTTMVRVTSNFSFLAVSSASVSASLTKATSLHLCLKF